MKQWVLSVAGIALISVIADVILPNGQTRKYIKTVIAIVVTVVVTQPLVQLFNGNAVVTVQSDVAPQQQYLSYLEQTHGKDVENLTISLEERGFKAPTVSFDVKRGCYTVDFSEGYSAENQKKAQEAVLASQCDKLVKFQWNNAG